MPMNEYKVQQFTNCGCPSLQTGTYKLTYYDVKPSPVESCLILLTSKREMVYVPKSNPSTCHFYGCQKKMSIFRLRSDPLYVMCPPPKKKKKIPSKT